MDAVDFQEHDQQERPGAREKILGSDLVRQGNPFALTDLNGLGQIIGQAVGYEPAVHEAETDDIGVDGVESRIVKYGAAAKGEILCVQNRNALGKQLF
ncbi:MAG: hypothetical protein WBK77_01940 [Alphaproteobacteria bacterium]